jgi:Xaa-Pro dipeptidase
MLESLNRCDLTPKEEVDRRIGELKKRMVENHIDFVVILQHVDLFYFTGTMQKGSLFIPVDDDPVLFIERTMERALYETPLPITPIKKDKDVKDVLAAKGLLKGKGALELDVLPVALFERWKGFLGSDSFADASSMIRDVRLIKSPFEIDQIRKSGQIGRAHV